MRFKLQEKDILSFVVGLVVFMVMMDAQNRQKQAAVVGEIIDELDLIRTKQSIADQRIAKAHDTLAIMLREDAESAPVVDGDANGVPAV